MGAAGSVMAMFSRTERLNSKFSLQHHAHLAAQLCRVNQTDINVINQDTAEFGYIRRSCTNLVRVLLPEPDRPTMPITSPGRIPNSRYSIPVRILDDSER